MEDKATIVDSGNKWLVGAQIVINAPASEIFAIVSNPKMHPQIDGSKMVKGGITGPDHLKLGDTFYMHMSIGIPLNCCEFKLGIRLRDLTLKLRSRRERLTKMWIYAWR